MTDPPPDSLGSGLVLEELLPLRCHVRDAADTDLLVSHQHASEEVLRIILALDDHHVDAADEHSGLAQELQRLDFKLNLVLDLVGQVLAQNLSLPARVPVRLAAHEVEWDGAETRSAGETVYVELYPCARYPRPVVLPGVVESVVRAGAGQRIKVGFDDLGEVVKDQLEMLIFRHHRRRIASTRRATPRA